MFLTTVCRPGNTLSTTRINNMLQRYIFFWLVASSGVAFYWPEFDTGFDPFHAAGGSAINVLIVVTMFSVGALLPVKEVDQILHRWPTVLIGTSIQYLSMPVLAWSIVQVMQPDPQIATGILIVGCVPGAMASNVLTLAARGNVSYSVSLTTSATLLSPIIVPIAMWLTVDDKVDYDGWAAVRLLVLQVVLPVVIGHLLSRFSERFRNVADVAASTVANLSILAIIAIAVALNRGGVTQASGGLLLALAVINAGGYLAGYFGGAAFRLPEPMRRALTLEVGMQNAGAGIALAKQLFGSESPAVIPCILYTFGCMLTGTILATIWQWAGKDATDSEQSSATAEAANS
ncbi:MAG: bile acid:sodium symporter family protein [Fuerstiella sp.]|nr:bile acid:sodium symporter family protein [Fuerstiella sp.]